MAIPDFPFPQDRLYERTQHMWVMREHATGDARVGIDALGLASLGDLAYIALHEIGTEVRRGQAMGTLEAAKMTGGIIAPVSGVVTARNSSALSDPYAVNQDPYGVGWLVMLRPNAWEAEAPGLVAGSAIAEWVLEEIARYREEGWID